MELLQDVIPPGVLNVVTGYGKEAVGKGQMGSALMGSLRISCLLTEGVLEYQSVKTFHFRV